MIEIKPCTAAEILSPENSWLIEEYAAESAIEGMPHPSGKLALYTPLEAAGFMQSFAAFDAGRMVGFIVVLVNELPHYGAKVGVTESWVVASDHRKTGAGIALLREAKRHAKAAGAVGMLISAPKGGRLERLMETMSGFNATNTVFFGALSDV